MKHIMKFSLMPDEKLEGRAIVHLKTEGLTRFVAKVVPVEEAQLLVTNRRVVLCRFGGGVRAASFFGGSFLGQAILHEMNPKEIFAQMKVSEIHSFTEVSPSSFVVHGVGSSDMAFYMYTATHERKEDGFLNDIGVVKSLAGLGVPLIPCADANSVTKRAT